MTDDGGLPEGPYLGPSQGPGQEDPPTIPPAPRLGRALRWAVPEEPPARAVQADQETEATRQVEGLAWLAPGQEAGPGTGSEALPVLPAAGAGPARPGPPVPPQGPRRRVQVALVAVGILVLLALAAAGGLWIARPSSGRARAVSTFTALLARSTQAHQLVSAAVNGVCAVKAPGTASRAGDLAKLERAISLRGSVLSDLGRTQDQAGRLPDGPELYRWLRYVTTASLAADRAYVGWAQDREDMGCYGGPDNDWNFDQATTAAGTAQYDVAHLSAQWAKVAPQLKLSARLADNV